MGKKSKKVIKLFDEYYEGHVYCVLNKLPLVKVTRTPSKKYMVILKGSKTLMV
jgi:hypothetical protein